MHIGVDFDDVLYPFYGLLKRQIHRRFGIDLTGTRVTTFYYEQDPGVIERGVTRDDVWEAVHAAWDELEDHDEAPLLDPDATPVLARLRERHRVTIVSARDDRAKGHVERFLVRHRIHPQGLKLAQREKRGFDALVDMDPKHALESVESGGHAILYSVDENSTFDEARHARIVRAPSWKGVEEAVDVIVRQRATIA